LAAGSSVGCIGRRLGTVVGKGGHWERVERVRTGLMASPQTSSGVDVHVAVERRPWRLWRLGTKPRSRCVRTLGAVLLVGEQQAGRFGAVRGITGCRQPCAFAATTRTRAAIERMHERQAQLAGYSPGCGCAKAVTRSLGGSSVSAERKWRLDRRVTGVQAGRNASGSQTAPSDQCLRPCVQQRRGKISVLNASAVQSKATGTDGSDVGGQGHEAQTKLSPGWTPSKFHADRPARVEPTATGTPCVGSAANERTRLFEIGFRLRGGSASVGGGVLDCNGRECEHSRRRVNIARIRQAR